jgi:hypothetical protein
MKMRDKLIFIRQQRSVCVCVCLCVWFVCVCVRERERERECVSVYKNLLIDEVIVYDKNTQHAVLHLEQRVSICTFVPVKRVK